MKAYVWHGSLAEMSFATANVRFQPLSGHRLSMRLMSAKCHTQTLLPERHNRSGVVPCHTVRTLMNPPVETLGLNEIGCGSREEF
jgi:hypothetical protein